MAGQSPSRRQLLQAFACATLAAGAPGFVRWSFAFAAPTGAAPDPTGAQHTAHSHPGSTHPAQPHTYKPVCFTPSEYALVELLAELILPRTGGGRPAVAGARAPLHPSHPHKVTAADAGATDAGVAEFIDFMASQDSTVAEPFRNGLQWLEGASSPDGFAKLAPPEQTALLTRLAYRAHHQAGDLEGQKFFALMRRYTVMGFYTTRIGLEQLDYPGLQFYGESPAVPNDGSLERVLNA